MLDVSAGEIIVYVNNDTSQQVIGLWMEGEDYIRILSGEDEQESISLPDTPVDIFDAVESAKRVIDEHLEI